MSLRPGTSEGGMTSTARIRLHPDDLEAIARQVVGLGGVSLSPWMTAAEAAAYLRCPVSRIRKLTAIRELPCHRDGRRVLYHRDELDDYIARGGATSP